MGLFFTFEGRIGRGTYLKSMLAIILVFFAAHVALVLLEQYVGREISYLVRLAGDVAFFWSWAALSAKSLHDLGHSTWALLIFLVPAVNVVILVLLVFMPGEEWENRFGPPIGSNEVAAV